ncbi:MAG: hypothetical protein GY750_14275 [Lentisphaerae bacterium]|nr:hypothetical protein [Lentisphaerota bacterium]MCP4102567.1 hypothetical protein [Lentisphaerota bacterium]
MPKDYVQSINDYQCNSIDELINHIISVIAVYKHKRKLFLKNTSFSKGLAWRRDMFKSKTFRVGATGSNITISENIIVELQNCLEDGKSNESAKKSTVLMILNTNKSKYTRWGKGRKMIDAAVKTVTAYRPRTVVPVKIMQNITSLASPIIKLQNRNSSMLNVSSNLKPQSTSNRKVSSLSLKKNGSHKVRPTYQQILKMREIKGGMSRSTYTDETFVYKVEDFGAVIHGTDKCLKRIYKKIHGGIFKHYAKGFDFYEDSGYKITKMPLIKGSRPQKVFRETILAMKEIGYRMYDGDGFGAPINFIQTPDNKYQLPIDGKYIDVWCDPQHIYSDGDDESDLDVDEMIQYLNA